MENNTPTLNFVLLGHWREKGTENSETQKIIRIIGPCPDITRPNHFVDSDKKVYSEYELLENYDYLATTHNDKSKTPKKLNLLAGLGNSEDIEDIETGNKAHKISIEEIPKHSFNTPPTVHNINIPTTPTNNFLDNIFKKLDVKDKSPININFELILGFNMEKLRNTIELLDLNVDEVSEYIVNNLISKKDLINSLTKQITEENFSDNLDIKTEQISNPIISIDNKIEIIDSKETITLVELDPLQDKIKAILSKYK